jgi:hypothetical protein
MEPYEYRWLLMSTIGGNIDVDPKIGKILNKYKNKPDEIIIAMSELKEYGEKQAKRDAHAVFGHS